jgi:hypothetical protein
LSNYTKSTNFATKDNLSPGDPLKIVRGTEIDTEFNNISTAISTKTDNSAAAITGGSISGITDLAVADGGTGASTATAALNNLLPSQSGNSSKYLQTDGTNATWDAISINTGDITGTLPVANGGTGVTSSTGTGSVVLSNSPTLVTPALGTPASGVATNLTGLPISTGVSGLGTGVAAFLATPSSANLASAVSDETGSGALVFANSPTLVTPALGTPSALVGTNITGTASGLTAGNVTTNANLTGAVTSSGNATSLGSFSSANLLGALTDETGTGSAVFATSPTLVTPILGTPTSATLTNATGLPISTGVSGLGTGIATALAVNVGSSGAPLVNGGVLGTPSSGTATNLTGLPLTTGVTGTLPTANGGTGLTSFTSGGVVYASSSSALATGSTLVTNGSSLGVGSSDFGGAGSINVSVGVVGTTTGGLQLWSTTTGQHYVQFGDGTSGAASYAGAIGYNHTSDRMDFYSAGTLGMSFNSTGLGIGTSSPAYKLDVNGVANFADNTIHLVGGRPMFARGGASMSYLYAGTTALEWRNNADTVALMRLDSSGNLGLGVTPSAWNAGKAIEVGSVGNSLWGVGVGEFIMAQGTYYNSGYKYANSSYAVSTYEQFRGTHVWKTAASGTAGNAISFTQAMTLDASGNLQVGLTGGTGRINLGASGTVALNFTNTTTSAVNSVLGYYDSTYGALSVGDMAIYTPSNRNVVLMADGASGIIKFASGGNAERARIDTSGNLLVGTTTSSVATEQGIVLAPNSGFLANNSTTFADVSLILLYSSFSTADQTKFEVTSSGDVKSRTNSYAGFSDVRLKQGITPSSSQWNDIKNIEVVKFQMKSEQFSDAENPWMLGVIAQQVEQVSPGLVDEDSKDGMKTVKYSILYMKAVKALQEAMTRIEQLEARLSAANL